MSPRDRHAAAGAEHAPRQRPFERHRRELANPNFASAIYGEIVVLSVLAALAEHPPSAEAVLGTVMASQLVFWLAHAYAETVSRQLKASVEGKRLGWRGVVDVMEHEWPLVQAAGPTVVLMILSLLGLFEVHTGIDIAFGVGIFLLFGWGIFTGRRGGGSLGQQLTVGLLSGLLGIAIVGLKILIH